MSLSICTAPDFSGGEVLMCPRCNYDFMHQDSAVEYQRHPYDDPSSGRSIKRTTDGQISIVTKENPSPRRDGLRIAFECEGCGSVGDLCIAQHKGQTFVWWDVG
jgi:hypothetical protein